ncbi:MAG: DUF1467 family protein [Sphingopyxis sp.]
MSVTSSIAIYVILWFFCLFLVLPFHAQSAQGDGAHVPGQATSAPAHFPFLRVVGQVSCVAALLFSAYLANYIYGWISADDINILGHPPARG